MTRQPASTTVLVTGGAGYIGSHACKALAAAGYLPVAFDSLEYGHEWAVQWGPFEHGHLEDRERLREVMQRHAPQAVMHFAAYAYVGESVTDPARYYRNNVAGTLTLLEAMREHDIRRIVFSSTCATYGNPLTPLLAEDHPQNPINPYGRSKLMIEQILADFAAAYGLRYAALRYFNAAGADPEARIGEDHDPETHLIPLAIAAALGGTPLRVFGNDYPTPDGTAIRDYIHVDDLADAHVAALGRLEAKDECLALNLGTGRGHSVREVIDAVEKVSGQKVPHTDAARRAGDPPQLVADATLAKDMLHWQARYTSLEDIVATAWRWHGRSRQPAFDSGGN
ncbi:MAG: UDP-glucose 4-epimerase GalE [Ectothiorhodospiraceae bacterium]|jgi:UDP-glucose-4-epimerase GalE|nr:UDP-glucose 4-epimerase GalE [Ectothiorhodospiraceae bacterium]